MTDWRDDLRQLLTETDPDPVQDIFGSAAAQPVLGALASDPADYLFKTLDAPASVVRGVIGSAINASQGEGLHGIEQGQQQWDEAIMGLRQADLGPMGILKTPLEIGLNVALDPTTWTGVGLAGKAAKGLRAASTASTLAGRPGLSTVLRGASRGMQAAQLANDLPGKTVLPVVQYGVRKAGKGLEKVRPGILDDSARSLRTQRDTQLQNLAGELTANEGKIPSVMPDVKPVAQTPIAPVLPNAHPPGSAPDTINNAFRESWRNIWGSLTDPRLGITPGGLRGRGTGANWITPSDVDLTERHIDDMANIGAGVMMNTVTDSGGIMPNLLRASDGMQQLQQKIVADYGPGIQPYLPSIYDRIRGKLIDQGADPDLLMPGSRFLLPYGWANQTVSTRRITSLNRRIAAGTLTKEEALAELGAEGIKRGGNPDAIDAAAAMGAGFLSTLPQAEDDVYRQFRVGGALFPDVTAASNATAIVPKAFHEAVWADMGAGPLKMDQALANQALGAIGVSQPFGTTRQAWNAYMRKTFGEMPDEELDTLADMSVEVLYDAYVNAANDVSGNSAGARLLAQQTITDPNTGEQILDPQAFRPPQRRIKRDEDGNPVLGRGGKPKMEVVPETSGPLYGTHHTKIGGIGRDPGDIGSDAAQAIMRAIDVPARREELAAWYAPFSKSKQRLAVSDTHGKIPQAIFYGEQLRHLVARGAMAEGDDFAAVLAQTPMPTRESLTEILGGKTKALNVANMRKAIETLGEEPLRMTNPRGGLLPNLEQLMETFQRGAPLRLSPVSGDAQKWYSETAREIEAIVGAGNYEDATFLLDVIGVTSSSTEVSENAELALRALSEWKFGKDTTLRARFGMTGAQFDQARGEGLLRSDMLSSHRAGITRTVNEYERRRANPLSMPISPQVKAGSFAPKTFDYAGSFLVNIWRDQIEKKLGPNSPVMKAFNDALSLFTVDRHMSRMDFGATDVGEIDYFLSRERGLLGAKAAGLSSEEAQAAGWYWLRDRQGFLREIRADSDLAFALRTKIEDAWEEHPGAPGEIGAQTSAGWEDLVQKVGTESGFDLNDPAQRSEAVRQLYGVVQQEVYYRLLKQTFAKPEVARALKAAGLPDSIAAMQRQVLGIVRRGSHGLTSDELPIYGQDPTFTGEQLSPEDAERQRQLLSGMDDLDATTDTLFNHKVKEPVMEAYAERSMKAAANKVGETVDDLSDPGWPDRVAAKDMGWDPRLTAQDNELLQSTVKVGKTEMTYKTFIDTHKLKARTDMAALREAGISWGTYASPKQRLEAAAGDPKLEQIVADWNKEGIDILATGDPNQVAVHLLGKAIDKDEGVAGVRNSAYDLMKAAWGEQALLSGKYHTGNLSGAWLQNALAGVLTNPMQIGRDIWHAMKVIRAGSDQITREEALAALKGTQVAQKWGLEMMPVEVMRGGIRALTMGEEVHGPSAVGELVGRLTRSETLGRKAGWIFAANNDLALAIDTATRSPIWGQTFDDAMEREMLAWDAAVAQRGIHIPGFDATRPADLRPDAIKAHLVEQGMQDGVAENLMRSYVHIRGEALKEARSELYRVQFYGSRTNLDEMIGKVIPFHYWVSRATRYYGEEAIRHPYLLLNYMRLTDGIEDAQNDPGLSARQKGFLRLLPTPLGFSLLMNPDALFGVTKIFGMSETYDADGQTQLGGALNWLQARGIGLYPWVDGMFNLMGMYGNDFEPDLLGLRHKALVGGAVQYARAHLGAEPAGAPYAEAMGQARYAVSSFVAGVLPWLTEPVTPRAGDSFQEATLDTLIESVVIEQAKAANPNVTNQEILEIMSDPDSEGYEAAYRVVSEAGMVSQLLNFTAPVKFTMRHDARDVRMAEIDAVQEEADRLGKAPWEVAPTLDDLNFKARYKALTGKEYTPGDYETAKLEHDLSRAPLEAKPLLLAEAEYHAIGSAKDRGHFDAYYALLYGTDPSVAGLSDAGRQEIAGRYLEIHPKARKAVDEITAERDAYEQAHPEFAEFKAWQKRMFGIRDQLGGNFTEYRRQAALISPNAARYFAEQQEYIRKDEPDPEKRKDRLEQATTNMGAFIAITGKAEMRSIQGPFPGVPPVDLTSLAMAPPGNGYRSGGNDWSRQLAAFSLPGLNPIR